MLFAAVSRQCSGTVTLTAMRSLRSIFLVVALVAVSCGGSSSGGSSTTGTSEAGSTTTTTVPDTGIVDADTGLTGLTAELAAIREANDGNLPLADALDLFAAVFGPI